MYPISDVQFADANGSSIAYMIYGEGPATICAIPPMAQNIELAWDSPYFRKMFDSFASFSRQIMFDKRGTGMSDRSVDIPELDERVDELKAVMDHAGIDRAYLHGLSEGGPMAIMFAATYPDRVEGLILEATGATLRPDESHDPSSEAEMSSVMERWTAYTDVWGTRDSLTLAMFGPSLLDDPELVAWWPRYERQAANQSALMDLLRMNSEMDARGVLHRIDAPVLILHRRDDPIVPIGQAHETHRLLAEAGADVTFIEFEGHNHFTFAQDVEPISAAIERFTTGKVRERQAVPNHRVEISTLGHFQVRVDGEPIPTNAWGSKRARTLLKRLIVARGWPVSRDVLIDVLWPGEVSGRLNARLSVQLSAVRRVLHGAVIANRETVRLDLDAVNVDIERWTGLDDDAEIIEQYRGEFLVEDRYADWTAPARDEFRRHFVETSHRAAEHASAIADHHTTASVLRGVLRADPFDDVAHSGLVRSLHHGGRLSDARTAHADYALAMTELGVEPSSYDDITR